MFLLTVSIDIDKDFFTLTN